MDRGRVVGYRLTDQRTGGTLVYLPGVQALTPDVRAEIEGCDCLLVDGTTWTDDEMLTLFWINELYDPADPDTYPEKVLR